MEDQAAMNLEPQSWTWTKECTFPSDMRTAHNLIEEVMGRVRSERWNDKDIFAVEIILEESLTNAVKHGNDSDSSKMVRFACKLSRNKIYARIEDEGNGFDPNSLRDPREPANQMIESGRGVLLVKHFATKVEWNDRGNIVEFEKIRS
jgi:serine/threonine-protein kinase RsbW